MATNPTNPLSALEAHLQARSAADASLPVDPAAAIQQQQVLLQSFQTRVQTLTNARTQVLAQYDAAIARFQQKIGELQQTIQAAATTPPASNAGDTPS